jgi:hypothetical protein
MQMNANQNTLLRRDAVIAYIFPEGSRPSVRTFEGWKAKRMFPFVKLGGTCYFDPIAVRAALAKRFTVAARTGA